MSDKGIAESMKETDKEFEGSGGKEVGSAEYSKRVFHQTRFLWEVVLKVTAVEILGGA